MAAGQAEKAGIPERLGRFELRGELGSGGMSVVYEAWDSTLKRKVALKLLRVEGAAVDPEEARHRLLREAQAMARVTHTNVISVHEVGEWEDRVFIVMELVEARADAGTLTRWLAARPRGWREVLAMFVQAGKGLAAAHARDLVHRDFKPDNVLVDAEGRVRVTDFGLVGVTAGSDTPGDEDDVSTRLTRTGRLVGTPRFMAPEQHRAEKIDARIDQFAFCVALWHALHGAWPFAGQRYGELVKNVLDGRIADPPKGRDVPAWLERAVRRGLSVDPAARWRDMDELLAALAPPLRTSRRTTLAVGAAAVATLGAVGIVVATSGGEETPPRQGAAPAEPEPPGPFEPVVAPLTSLGGCAFQPLFIDGENVLFDVTVADGVDFYTVPAAGGTPVKRTDSPAVVEGFASRGRRPGEALYAVVYPDGSQPPSVMSLDVASWTSGRLTVPGFSPPAAVGETLYYPRTDLKEIRRIKDGVDEPFFTLPTGYALQLLASSPDGRWLAMTTGSSQSKRNLCLVDLAKPPELDCLAAVAPEGRPVFAPDSSALYYISTEGGIRRVDMSTRKDALAVKDVIAAGGFDVAPDGKRLVYSDCRAVTELTDVTASPPKVLATGRISMPDVSRDGRIVWAAGSDAGVLLRETDGTTRTIVPASFGPVMQPTFDDQGGRVVFRRRGAGAGIYVVDVTPYPPEPVTTSEHDFNPRFLDDKRIVFNRPADGQVHVYVSETTVGSERRAHPGSRYVSDVLASRGTVLLMSTDRRRLYEWDPATGKERELDLPAAIRDSKSELRSARAGYHEDSLLIQLGVQGGPLWRVPLGGDVSTAKILADAPDSVTVGTPAELPDGRVLSPYEVWRGELNRVILAEE